MGEDSSRKDKIIDKEELLNNIINESTITNVCAICKTKTRTQKHHLSYDPELVIDVCVPCHIKIHQHGVGRASTKKQESMPCIFDEKKLLLPLFTKTSEEGAILSKEGELLNPLTCPNCGMWQFTYQLLGSPSGKRTFLRCCSCGFYIEVKLLPRSEES